MIEIRTCKRHGEMEHHLIKDTKATGGRRWRCKRCNGESVSKRQRKVKALLVAEHGGCCQLCGYYKYQGALQFHHLDPATKAFSIQSGTSKALVTMRQEAAKCALLCANCHAEVEAGVAHIGP